MREKGGRLEIRLADIDIDVDFVKKHPEVRPGKFIQLSISDTGQGIEPELVERIFDPFFTTKDTGEGTGMGLAVVHGIVKTHGGAITLSSEPGAGSTFNVFIPAMVDEPPAKTATREDMPIGSERILFVDDESFQADLGRQMLERLGYQVVSKTCSIEALEAFIAAPQTFDLVITDMTMPNMTGDELSRRILAFRPDIPIIVCTGYSERISDENIKAIGIKRLAMKPIVMRNIANLIREVLD
jgi:CheY-like chemotaxis protein